MFDYAKKIREYRKRKLLKELAKILNVSYVSVCRWKPGKFELNMENKKFDDIENVYAAVMDSYHQMI